MNDIVPNSGYIQHDLSQKVADYIHIKPAKQNTIKHQLDQIARTHLVNKMVFVHV